MKKLSLLVILLLTTLLFENCKKDEIENSHQNEFLSFKKNFPNLSNKIKYSNVEYLYGDTKNHTEPIVTFPIEDGNNRIGRYIAKSDESCGLYIDFSDYQKTVTIYDINNPNKKITLNTIYDNKTGTYYVDNSNYRFDWCAASCYIGGLAIGLSDGPSPAMDILGYAYGVACLADCEL